MDPKKLQEKYRVAGRFLMEVAKDEPPNQTYAYFTNFVEPVTNYRPLEDSIADSLFAQLSKNIKDSPQVKRKGFLGMRTYPRIFGNGYLIGIRSSRDMYYKHQGRLVHGNQILAVGIEVMKEKISNAEEIVNQVKTGLEEVSASLPE